MDCRRSEQADDAAGAGPQVTAMFGKASKDHQVMAASFHYDNDETVYLVIGAIEDAGAIKIDTILITPAM